MLSLVSMYGSSLPDEITTMNRLCEKCRSRAASERIKNGQTGKKIEVEE
jgi:hypothetical protein